MPAWPALCALKARNARQKPSSSVNVRTPARRKAAETLAFALEIDPPKAEVTGSNPVGSAISFYYFIYLRATSHPANRPGTIELPPSWD